TEFVTSGADGITQAAALTHDRVAAIATEQEDLVVYGVDIGASEAQSLRAALGRAAAPVTMVLVALVRADAGDIPHAAIAMAAAAHQWVAGWHKHSNKLQY
ncbi:MAG: hypothetical protein ACKPKO_18815, partial [Candidatus Fonsibacter sp.]